ncbi:MAG: VWA domain-containing protein [Saprospiraceae bacterium]|nr:VWA domain-containing protein [Saprospiraceae bacterium]
MFRFEMPHFLYYLPLVAFAAVALFWAVSKMWKIRKKWGTAEVVNEVFQGGIQRPFRYTLYLFPVIAILALTGLANPQRGFRNETLKSTSSDVYIVLDISRSMDATDVAPSRLIRSKKTASDLIQKIKGNKIGLIFFAAAAYMQMPLTHDYSAAIMMVNTAQTNMAGNQGTNIAEVADLVEKANEKSGQDAQYLILITDGENHDGDAIGSIEKLAREGTKIYVLGAGTAAGGYVPYGGGYLQDDDGQPINTKVDQNLINDLAKAGNGRAFDVRDQKALEVIAADIEEGTKTNSASRAYTEYISYFQWLLALALLLMIFDQLIYFNIIKIKPQ